MRIIWSLGIMSLMWTLGIPGVGSAESALPASAAAATAATEIGAVEAAPIVLGQRLIMRSNILASDMEMKVWVPDSFELASAEHTYPVIFINGEHGNQFFSAVVGVVKHLGDRERLPESIVVSLTDMGDIPEILTHGMWSREKLGGGGDPTAGLRHLKEEVFPYLEKHYRANGFRLIIGVSGSSLFPVYALTEAPDLFRGHIWIAASDVLGMGYKQDETFIDTLEAMWSKRPDRRVSLYVGVAESDQDRPEYQENMKQLVGRLGRFEGLNLKAEVIPRDDHYAVLLRGLLSALDEVFPHERWSARYRDLVAQPGNALENIDRYYRELSKEYGFTILPRANRWNNVNCLRFMTRHLIRLERIDEAVEVAERRVKYQPKAAGSYVGLADAYDAAGRSTEAVEAQRKALKMAKLRAGDGIGNSIDQGDIERLKERLAELKSKLPG